VTGYNAYEHDAKYCLDGDVDTYCASNCAFYNSKGYGQVRLYTQLCPRPLLQHASLSRTVHCPCARGLWLVVVRVNHHGSAIVRCSSRVFQACTLTDKNPTLTVNLGSTISATWLAQYPIATIEVRAPSMPRSTVDRSLYSARLLCSLYLSLHLRLFALAYSLSSSHMRRLPACLYQVVSRQDSTTKLSRLHGATLVLASDDGATTLYKATIPASTGAQSRYRRHFSDPQCP